MTGFDVVVRGGTIATAADLYEADIGITGGVIAAIARDLPRGRVEHDARGRLVLPGGIDSHCHIDQPSSMGATTADDFYTGGRSAAAGGTTTLIPFAAQFRGQSLRQVVDDYHARARNKAVIDYAFHLIVSDPTEAAMGQELPALVREGITSFKIYLTYDALKLGDRQVLEVLSAARREGMLTMVHAENHDVIQWLSDRLLAAGHVAPKFHGVAHAAVAEREATGRAIALSEVTGTPILVVHVSGREAMETIRLAKDRGLRIYAETCPQYLFLSAEDLDRPGFDGAMCMCSPPPRAKDNQKHIWRGLANGAFDVFSSDHAPYLFNGPTGKRMNGDQPPFKKVANGVPGLAVRLPLLFSEGVRQGRIDIHQFVALTATNHARLYGLFPRKGTIAIGADADLAVWDPDRAVTITLPMLCDAMDYTPYEGRQITGWPALTLSRGEVVYAHGEATTSAGRGRFLACAPPAAARPYADTVEGFNPMTGEMAAGG
ncbi:MAG: dihydropyrimidinase [Thalassobaculales bacterium]